MRGFYLLIALTVLVPMVGFAIWAPGFGSDESRAVAPVAATATPLATPSVAPAPSATPLAGTRPSAASRAPSPSLLDDARDAAAISDPGPVPITTPPVRWRRSQAVGLPYDGSLRRGVQLPASGRDYVTLDSVTRRTPSRGWRRWGTDRLVRTILAGAAEYRRRHPAAPQVAVGDLSRRRGGWFGARYGGLGHRSHQNGLDVDVYYPRLDRRLKRPGKPRLVNRKLAQTLVDVFVELGADKVFVGSSHGLKGPREVVIPWPKHDDHLHLRIR